MAKKKMSSGEEQIGLIYYWWIVVRIWTRKNIIQRFRDYRARRPHRSFKLTRRRDYARPLEIGGYWKFTGEVFSILKSHKKQFRNLVLAIAGFSFFAIGLLDGDFLESLQSVLEEKNRESGNLFGEVGKAGLIVISTFSTGGLVRSPNDSQKMAMFLIALFAWLAVVQLCRDIVGGKKKLSLRDALYSCGAPIIPMVVTSFVMLVQMIPAFLAVIVFAAAQATNFASIGAENAMFTAGALLLVSISIYWVMGSFLAMIITTNPRIYPAQALKLAGDMISQRRLKVLYRLIWAVLLLAVLWFGILIPLILLVNWASSAVDFIQNIPIVQVSMLILSSFSIVFLSVYIYLLYRKILDVDQK